MNFALTKAYGTKHFDRAAFAKIVNDVCGEYGIKPEDLRGNWLSHKLRWCRALVCHRARTELGASYCALGDEFRFTREACAKSCLRVANGYMPKRAARYKGPPRVPLTPEERAKRFAEVQERNRLRREEEIDRKIAELVSSWNGLPMTQVDIALRLGVGSERVREIERSATLKMAKALGCDPYVNEWIETTKEALC